MPHSSSPTPPPFPSSQLDTQEGGGPDCKLWTRQLYTSALETLLISPPRSTLLRNDPDLLTAGISPHAAWHGEGVREVPLEDEEGGKEGKEAEMNKPGGGVGLGMHKKTKMGGLGRLKDYSKRKAEVPNPWAPPQVGE